MVKRPSTILCVSCFENVRSMFVLRLDDGRADHTRRIPHAQCNNLVNLMIKIWHFPVFEFLRENPKMHSARMCDVAWCLCLVYFRYGQIKRKNKRLKIRHKTSCFVLSFVLFLIQFRWLAVLTARTEIQSLLHMLMTVNSSDIKLCRFCAMRSRLPHVARPPATQHIMKYEHWEQQAFCTKLKR